eukprot:2178313-Prymnesium_polylepis.2
MHKFARTAAGTRALLRCRNRTVALRYLPPGAMELNLTTEAAEAVDARAVFLGILPTNTSGGAGWHPGFLRRGACFADLERAVGRSRVHHTAAVWSMSSLWLVRHGAPRRLASRGAALRAAPHRGRADHFRAGLRP